MRRLISGQAYKSFACFFAGQGIPESILQATYRVLAHRISRFVSVPIHSLDSLYGVYRLDCYRDDALADLMSAIRLACSVQFYKPVPTSLPCETVADLIYLLAAQCDAVYLPEERIGPPIVRNSENGRLLRPV